MKTRTWLISVIILLGAGAVFDFVLSGRDYIAYTLYLAAALIVIFNIAAKTIKRIVGLLLVICIIYFAAVEVPIIKNSSGDEGLNVQYIIVLGAAVHGDTPSLSLTERMDAAYDYLTANPDTTAILSGGQGSGENMSEAQAMYDYLSGKGIAPDRLLTEDKSTSTYENLKNSFAIIRERGDDPDGTTAVVTSEYHIYRAKLIGRALGVELGGIAAGTSLLSVRINYFIREAFGVTYQWITEKLPV